jgi:C1A family cysteine protease
MRKLRISIALLLILILLFAPTVSIGENSKAEELTDLEEIDTSTYSERYQEWLSLDDETRAKTLAPSMYEIEYKPKLTKGLSASTLPSKYILTEDIDITVKNQKQTNECWAFTSIGAVETNLSLTKNETNWDFSERHMDYSTSKTFTDGINSNGFNRELGDGGTFRQAMAYYTSGRGPILEENMPFENNETRKPLSYINGTNYEVQKKVEDYITFPTIVKGPSFAEDMTDFRNSVKQHIMSYGSIAAQVAYPTGTWQYSTFDNKNVITYCNSTNANLVNHAVSIVGWDDNYAVTNFKEGVRPSKPGAYIVRGSWGTGSEADVIARFRS